VVAAREGDAGDLVCHRVADDPEMGATTAGMLPDLVVVTSRVQPVVNIGVPGVEVLRGRLRTLAVAIALIGELDDVARAAIGAGDQQ
jgi:hypothetical protein